MAFESRSSRKIFNLISVEIYKWFYFIVLCAKLFIFITFLENFADRIQRKNHLKWISKIFFSFNLNTIHFQLYILCYLFVCLKNPIWNDTWNSLQKFNEICHTHQVWYAICNHITSLANRIWRLTTHTNK